MNLDLYMADSSSYENTLEICLWIGSLVVSKLVPWLRDSAQPCFGSLAEAGKEAGEDKARVSVGL